MSLCGGRRQHEKSAQAQEAAECLLRHTLNEGWWQHPDWQVTSSICERVRLVAKLMLKVEIWMLSAIDISPSDPRSPRLQSVRHLRAY